MEVHPCCSSRRGADRMCGQTENNGWRANSSRNSILAAQFRCGPRAGATYDGSGCSGTVTWLENGIPYYTFSFSLKDLDPPSARSVQTVVSPPALQNMWSATAVTTNNLKKVAVYNHHTRQNEQDDSVIEGTVFRSAEDADRFAKALHHAIGLCGGKPSLF
jgi:hypothetical protein